MKNLERIVRIIVYLPEKCHNNILRKVYKLFLLQCYRPHVRTQVTALALPQPTLFYKRTSRPSVLYFADVSL